MTLTEAELFAVDRPHKRLLRLYMIRAVLTGPGLLIMVPLLYFRYETMRFRFDSEGIHMRWGILFHRQVNLTYARIQDIHLTSGLIQRWLGLADIKIQTASGSAGAEMTLEGLLEYEAIRDFLYARMRGYRDRPRAARELTGTRPAVPGEDADAAGLLREAIAELRATRVALETSARRARAEEPRDV